MGVVHRPGVLSSFVFTSVFSLLVVSPPQSTPPRPGDERERSGAGFTVARRTLRVYSLTLSGPRESAEAREQWSRVWSSWRGAHSLPRWSPLTPTSPRALLAKSSAVQSSL
ncbi:hypothetical protein RRG08_046009 [Elysia crispata]|uniref:Secreted protein n=1 Tax=Elysia crispata TaxID=231223 RepID=A0AAE1DDQ3_9GAST|nr:hypothetical protein RRG08_046009 [Elysia crispata]